MRRTIARKRDGAALEPRVWAEAVAAFLAGRVDDAQMSALLMASVLRGLEFAETRALTEAFVRSGETLALPGAPAVDKHSSGGVGDTASLVVVPLVAACGVPVAKLSGRALGHTGGTLDKLEAVAGTRTEFEPHEFFACVRAAGCAIAAQSARLVPADKRVYALRDRTATVPSLGLIAASIVSKKIAGGAASIVYDVKTGRGAFLQDCGEAFALAETLVTLTRSLGRAASALVTDMDEPLGPAIGTGLEALEARDFLEGTRRDARLGEVCEALGRALLEAAGFIGDAGAALRAALDSGRGAERFAAMLRAQGAAPGALAALVPDARARPVRAAAGGFVTGVDPVALGEIARDLVTGGGSQCGIVVARRTGECVSAGDLLATVYGDPQVAEGVRAAFALGAAPPAVRPLVYGEITGVRPRSTLETR